MSGWIRSSIARFRSLAALAVMVIAMSLLSDKFLTVANGSNILRQISVNLCLSIGMTLVVLTGGIDLSVGAVLALSGAAAAWLLKNGLAVERFDVLVEFTPFGAMLAGVLIGFAMGVANGAAITRFRLPPFIATLGTLSIARGLTMLWTGGFPITGLGSEFGFIGVGVPLGIPMPVWISAALAVVFIAVMRHTVFGRCVYAVGGNPVAARYSGLPVARTRFWTYVLAGGLSAVAGLLITARLDSAQPNAGLGYELDSIAAVVIGGTSLSGGRGSIGGTVLGCLIIGVLNNGLFLLDVSPFFQLIIKGIVILVAVAVDRAGSEES